MGIIVAKFGGISLSDAETIRNTVSIIKSDPSRRYVVVSSPGIRSGDEVRITDMFYLCHSRYTNRENFTEMLDKIEARFREIVQGLGISIDVHAYMAGLKKDLFLGRTQEYIVSRGEYIMGKIMAEVLGWEFVDAAELIFFNRDGTLNQEKTISTIKSVLSKVDHAVIPGFYGVVSGTNIKTFERGGGDMTGALIACALEADFLEKWAAMTEIFSADPSIVKSPTIIRNITYAELRELAYMGINVVYDDIILLMEQSGIPTKLRNVHHLNDEGTLITKELPADKKRDVVACIAGRRNYKVIQIRKFGMNKAVGISQKVFATFTNRNIPCEHYLSGIYQLSIILKNPMFDLRRTEIIDELYKAVNPESIEVQKDLSLIAVVGEGMGTVKGIFAKVFDALAAAHIKVRLIEQGGDDLNILIGVYDEDFDASVKALYDALIVH